MGNYINQYDKMKTNFFFRLNFKEELLSKHTPFPSFFAFHKCQGHLFVLLIFANCQILHSYSKILKKSPKIRLMNSVTISGYRFETIYISKTWYLFTQVIRVNMKLPPY